VTRTRGLARFLILAAINLVILGVLAEVGARVLYPAARGGGFTWAEARIRLDAGFRPGDIERSDRATESQFTPGWILHPYLGWAMDPSTKVVKDGAESFPYSRMGFHGGDIAAPAEDEVVVAISGGSVAEWLWVDARDELRDALQADPRFAGKRIRIENFALAGYKQPQELLTLNYLLVQGARFHIWISLDGFNEITQPVIQNLPEHVAPVYPRSWHILSQRAMTPGELQIRAARYAAMTRREAIRRRVDGTVLKYSAFIVACWDAVDLRHAQQIARLDTAYQELSARLETTAAVQGPLFGLPEPDFNAVLRQSVDIWVESTYAMATLCNAHKIAYFQFVQPNQYVDGSKPFTEEELRTAFAPGGYRPAVEKGYPLLVDGVKQLQARGVRANDLTRVFENETATLYRDTCCHVIPEGSRIMARRIAETIRASELP